MVNTIAAGDYAAIIEGEDVHRVVTELRVRGSEGRLTTNQAEAAAGRDSNGHLVEDGDDRTMFDPQGKTWYMANVGQEEMEVYTFFDGRYLDNGGL